MKIRDLMTGHVVTCARHDSLAYAAQLMWDHDCGAVVVLDGQGRVVGMLTDRDVCMAAWSKGAPLRSLRAGDTASTRIFAVGPDDPIELAEARMRAHQVRRLPVIDVDGALVGILSLADVACHLHRVTRNAREGLSSESIALTLASITRPRAPAAVSIAEETDTFAQA